tara:strand:- start:240 stop:452 length:213 start_codon:yes stop_codon:yes gene_type:complete
MITRKSQINQAINGVQTEELDVFEKTMSPYVRYGNPMMTGFLDRLERYYMHCYNSIEKVENIYNYTKENK